MILKAVGVIQFGVYIVSSMFVGCFCMLSTFLWHAVVGILRAMAHGGRYLTYHSPPTHDRACRATLCASQFENPHLCYSYVNNAGGGPS